MNAKFELVPNDEIVWEETAYSTAGAAYCLMTSQADIARMCREGRFPVGSYRKVRVYKFGDHEFGAPKNVWAISGPLIQRMLDVRFTVPEARDWPLAKLIEMVGNEVPQ